eukprot:762916-Hanusia_phi.AAC.4
MAGEAAAKGAREGRGTYGDMQDRTARAGATRRLVRPTPTVHTGKHRSRAACAPQDSMVGRASLSAFLTFLQGSYGNNWGGSSYNCPQNSYSEAGSTQCRCKYVVFHQSQEMLCESNYRPGYVGTMNSCRNCPTNYFCPGDRVQTSCPGNTYSSTNAKSASDCKCNAGYINLAYSHSVNWFYVEASSWNDAKAKCESGSGHLASIHDAQEMAIAAAVCSTAPCFIGLYRSSSQARWAWVDGSSVTYYGLSVSVCSLKRSLGRQLGTSQTANPSKTETRLHTSSRRETIGA